LKLLQAIKGRYPVDFYKFFIRVKSRSDPHLEEVAGDWAMAKYIEATETEDQKQRDELMDQILAYNREDLEATWAVLQWLKSKIQ